MHSAELANKISGAKLFGTRWKAACPAHDDRTPSLSFKDGDRGVVVTCFAGCTLPEICTALDMVPADLFYDAPRPRGTRPIPKPISKDPRDTAFRFELEAFDLRTRAERIFDAAKTITVSSLTDADLDRAI